MIASDLALGVFVACNGIRAIAYVPQIVQLVRERQGARTVSCLTWALFALANASTVAYAVAATGDLLVALTFSLNMICCLAIFGIAAWKRRSRRLRSLCVPKSRSGFFRALRRSYSRYVATAHRALPRTRSAMRSSVRPAPN